jgi:hypothetical protein
MESCTMQHEGFPPRSLLTPTAHRLSFPTCLSHPGNIHLHCSTVHRLLHFPSRASTTGRIRNSQSSVAVVGLPPGEITSPTISLTWRELLTGLTTCFFYSSPKSTVKTTAKMGKARDDSANYRGSRWQRVQQWWKLADYVLLLNA